MALVSSASRRVRKMGQVRVFGFSKGEVGAESAMWRFLSFRSSMVWAKKTKSACGRVGLCAAEQQDAELEAADPRPGKTRCRFSKSYRPMSVLDSIKSAKNSLVVLSVATPDGDEQTDAAGGGDESCGPVRRRACRC